MGGRGLSITGVLIFILFILSFNCGDYDRYEWPVAMIIGGDVFVASPDGLLHEDTIYQEEICIIEVVNTAFHLVKEEGNFIDFNANEPLIIIRSEDASLPPINCDNEGNNIGTNWMSCEGARDCIDTLSEYWVYFTPFSGIYLEGRNLLVCRYGKIEGLEYFMSLFVHERVHQVGRIMVHNEEFHKLESKVLGKIGELGGIIHCEKQVVQ